MTFPKIKPGEIKMLTFDFGGEAAPSSTLVNPNVTATVVSGDGDPTDIDIDPSIQVDGLKLLVLAGGASTVNRTTYRIRCEADADNGEHHIIEKDLPVSDDAALVK